jgi:hypothetical protein
MMPNTSSSIECGTLLIVADSTRRTPPLNESMRANNVFKPLFVKYLGVKPRGTLPVNL